MESLTLNHAQCKITLLTCNYMMMSDDRLAGFLLLFLATIPASWGDVSHLAFNGVNNHFSDDISLLRNAIRGEPNVDYPIYSFPPQTSFTCAGRHDGYYADTETRCQVFRVCANTDLTGRGFAFLCPNGTLFNQRHFVCDWHYNVNCAESPAFYAKNEQLGKRIESHDHMMTMVKYMQNFVMAQGFGQAQPSVSQSGSAVFNAGGGSTGTSNFGASLSSHAGGSSFGQAFGDSSSSATNFDASSKAHQKIYVSNLGELSTEPGSGFDLSKSNIISHNLDFQQSGASNTFQGADFSGAGHSKVSSHLQGKLNAVFSGTGNLIGFGSHTPNGKFSGSAIQSNSIYLPPRPQNTYIPPAQHTYTPQRVTPQVFTPANAGSTKVSPSFPGNLVTTPPRVVVTTPPTTTARTTEAPLLDIRFGDDETTQKTQKPLNNANPPSMYFSLPLDPVEIKERELKKLGLLPSARDQDSAKEGSAFFPQRVQFTSRLNPNALPLHTGFSTPAPFYQTPQATSFSNRFDSKVANQRVTDIQIIPAQGYYFNDPNERKQYYDAVARGLYDNHRSGYVYIRPQFSQFQEVSPRAQRFPTVSQQHELQHSGSQASPLKVLEARDTESSIFRGFDSYAAPLSHVGRLPTDTLYSQSPPRNSFSSF
ncbi:uncharacterized protein LOC132258524 [Phlebotomus argentipes]|uniref:uncharacterized protein LOC132258524 n=1 Tax=Phlebotomus argentipes TaxID=94469 RepID=UPI002892AC96|nr:uncharacterized protein LOC132258524 [Phlebotomus argentipes]